PISVCRRWLSQGRHNFYLAINLEIAVYSLNELRLHFYGFKVATANACGRPVFSVCGVAADAIWRGGRWRRGAAGSPRLDASPVDAPWADALPARACNVEAYTCVKVGWDECSFVVQREG
ncbi:MAG: hypothetical protein AAGD34_02625, partial [Pseudomonadota bacterium]